MKTKLQVGDKQTISTCKKDRNSTWPGTSSPRRTTKGMHTVVTISKNSKGEKISTTTYESSKGK